MWTVLIIAAAVLVLAALVGYAFFAFSTGVKKPKIDPKYLKDPVDTWGPLKTDVDKGRAWIWAQNPRQISITSLDGLKLNGYFVPAETESKKTVLMMHGYHSSDFNDFACSVKYFHDYGVNILLADQRGHGQSQGKRICFGVKEKYDCEKWVEWIDENVGGEIILMGVSMGCATVLMALGLELPESVKGCIADCGYTSPEDIFKHVLKKDFHLPVYPFLWVQDLYCRTLGGFNIHRSTLEALEKNRRPVLFVHGGKDDFVPAWMSYKNYEACKGPKEILIVDDAEHAMSFMRDPEKCFSAMRAFMDRWL